MKFFFLLFFPFLLISAEPFSFTISSDKLKINEPLKVSLEIDGSILELDELKETLRGNLLQSGHFMLIDEKFENKNDSNLFQWTLEPLEAGFFPLSFYAVKIQSKQVFFPIQYVTVEPFLAPNAIPSPPLLPLVAEIPPTLSSKNLALLKQLQAVQPKRNYELFLSKQIPWYTFLAALTAALLAPFIIFFLRKKRSEIPLIAPVDAALATLEEIDQRFENKGYASPSDFVVDLTQIMRKFIQENYDLAAPYLTTEEFLNKAASHPELVKGSEKLILFLKAADRVKFAKRTPSLAELSSAINFAKSYLEHCKR